MNTMILVLTFAIVALIPLAEIAFDHWRWNQDPPKDDKPVSTILRLVLFGVFSFVMHITGVSIWYYALLLVFSGHFWIFDQGLNISRWKELKKMKLSYNFRIHHGIPMNMWHKAVWGFTKFMNKFCYHSNKGTDRIYSRIPGVAELAGKATLLGTAIYLFLEQPYTFLDQLIINLDYLFN